MYLAYSINYDEIKHIFRAYDIRGIFNEEITPQNHFRIGLAFGTFLQLEQGLKDKHVFIAYDIRQTSSLLAQAFAAGVMATGINIEFSGEPLQFGACMFSAWKGKDFATAFITASHLPPEWNGVKFYYGNGTGFSEEDNERICEIFVEGKFMNPRWDKVGQMTVTNLKEKYEEFLMSKFSLKRKLKVVVDCGNGTSCLSAPTILRGIGLKVIPLFCKIDPTFPNRSSEPNEKSLRFLAKKVMSENADFGVGFDGDGDRAVVVDDKGRVLLADITGLILAKFMIEEFPHLNRVLANVECSLVLEKVLSPPAIIDRIKVGHTYLTADAQIKTDTLIGIESSGHMVFPTVYPFDDAMIIPLKLAEILSKQDRALSKIVDELPTLNKRKIAITCPDRSKFKVISELLSSLQSKYDNINPIDGIGVPIGKGSWVLIRASNTGPKIRIIVEAETETQAKDLLSEFQSYLEAKINEVIN
jgi:phosphomannomutase